MQNATGQSEPPSDSEETATLFAARTGLTTATLGAPLPR